MSKYTITGYYGRGNVGDEALLCEMIKTIKSRDKLAEIEVLSYNPHLTEKEHNIDSRNIKNPISVFMSIFKSDQFIFAGGGHEFSNSALVLYVFVTTLFAKIIGKKVIAYAIGVEIGTNKKTGMLSKKIIKLTYSHFFDLITLRDKESKDIFINWGVVSELTATSDPVVSYESYCNKQELSCRIIKHFGGSKNIVGVCFNNKEKEYSRNEFTRTITHLINHNYKVVIIPMCIDEGDFKIAEDFKVEHQSNGDIFVIDWLLSLDELYDVMGCFDFSIGMRYHYLIISAIRGVPFISVSRSNKVKSFTKLLKQFDLFSEEKSIEDAIDIIIQEKRLFQNNLVDEFRTVKERETINKSKYFEITN